MPRGLPARYLLHAGCDDVADERCGHVVSSRPVVNGLPCRATLTLVTLQCEVIPLGTGKILPNNWKDSCINRIFFFTLHLLTFFVKPFGKGY